MPPSQHRKVVEQLSQELLERLRRGDRPSWQEYGKRFPEHADAIRGLFPILLAVEELAP
jgi:hypothetical protein